MDSEYRRVESLFTFNSYKYKQPALIALDGADVKQECSNFDSHASAVCSRLWAEAEYNDDRASR